MRLDLYMVQSKMASGREKAKELIKNGQVNVNSKVCTKPAFEVCSDDTVEITGETLKYVGRGGLKLEKIISRYSVDLRGRICMDVGASTGGFTDCMLQNGARMVYAVDVGSGQLAEKLLSDVRVCSMEKTDVRSLKKEDFPYSIDFISADVSFISLKHILPSIFSLLGQEGQAAVLIKPQFEAGRENIGKRGIVKSPKVHERVLQDIYSLACGIGFRVIDICVSPVKGSGGNIEYLIYMDKSGGKPSVFDFKMIVKDAFDSFKTGGN